MKLLQRLYTDLDSRSSFGGAEALFRDARKIDSSITRKEVIKFLHSSNTYTLHHPLRQRVRTGRTRCSWIDSDHQADLCIMTDLASENRGYAYILVVVDVLSRYLWCEPMKRKTGTDSAAAYTRVLTRDKRVPYRLYTDAGKEFIARTFQDVLSLHEIEHRIPKNHDVKCAFAENGVKRIKQKIFRYFTEQGTMCWVDILPSVVRSLNATPNRTIGVAPVDVTAQNAASIWDALYGHEKMLIARHKFQIGAIVRLSLKNQLFRKGYRQTFTKELFRIRKRLFADPAAYIIEDLSGEEIDSIVYEQELIPFTGSI